MGASSYGIQAWGHVGNIVPKGSLHTIDTCEYPLEGFNDHLVESFCIYREVYSISSWLTQAGHDGVQM